MTEAQTQTTTRHDPDVERILIGISEIRHERDSLLLDKTKLQDDLRAADSTIANLQQQVKTAMAQRDSFMVRLVELTTNYEMIRSAVKGCERAFDAATRHGAGIKPDAMLKADETVARIAQNFSPEATD